MKRDRERRLGIHFKKVTSGEMEKDIKKAAIMKSHSLMKCGMFIPSIFLGEIH